MTKHAENLAKLGWQYFECPACGSEGARAFPKPAQQEPVAWISHNAGLYHFKPDESLDPLPLYLAPPAQRTWVGLTEDEAFACKGRDYFETYKAIEAKLKEKNT